MAPSGTYYYMINFPFFRIDTKSTYREMYGGPEVPMTSTNHSMHLNDPTDHCCFYFCVASLIAFVVFNMLFALSDVLV